MGDVILDLSSVLLSHIIRHELRCSGEGGGETPTAHLHLSREGKESKRKIEGNDLAKPLRVVQQNLELRLEQRLGMQKCFPHRRAP